ncbi:MAG: opioid growth factor receptor-related protein [Shewanella sp.]
MTLSTQQHTDLTVKFFKSEIADNRGNLIDTYQKYDDFWLEHDHKFIQLLFPIDTGTRFNRHAPLVNELTIATFEQDPALKAAHLANLDRLLAYYSMQRSGSKISAARAINPKNCAWLKWHDHNQLRLTRIMRSIWLLTDKPLAYTIRDFIVHHATSYQGSEVRDITIQHWQHFDAESSGISAEITEHVD